MMFWNRPKVEFLCLEETIQHLYPIVEARKLHPTWFDEETTRYATGLCKSAETADKRSIVKCRGIRKLLNTGWVARTWQDIKLIVYEDGRSEWRTQLNQKGFSGCQDMVEYHNPELLEKCPVHSNNIPILKIQLPWVAKLPDGYNMMQLPVNYGDDDRFITATGIFERAFGLMELNVQLLWKAGAGEFLIKAGTPIAHYILVKDENYTMSTALISAEDRRRLVAEINTKQNTFCSHYTTIKKHLKQLTKGK